MLRSGPGYPHAPVVPRPVTRLGQRIVSQEPQGYTTWSSKAACDHSFSSW